MKTKLLGLMACMAMLGVVQANAATITFEGVVASSADLSPATPPAYTEAGFSLTDLFTLPNAIYGATFPGINTNGTSVFGWSAGAGCGGGFCFPSVIELTAVGGAAFSLSSMDAANLESTSAGFEFNQEITAVGNLKAGGTITETLVLTNTWTTFTFPGFASLASVDFSAVLPETPDPAIDNIVVSTTTPLPTPLPATLPLFATGLGALGLLGWRRKRKASKT